ncbi:tetratricopeptide repeat protein [Chitinimonas sp. BJYL2]|uniref:O-linked N-acetylglucosamine transferase, SPINDLY family protein n=1 Tax=Chitinimonas sp. BJYL2 TaxID=2976696 RepID=UPI0022B57953|nr:tetratricopeptide repeat protein [Chitinimonas sp. BJYL2]
MIDNTDPDIPRLLMGQDYADAEALARAYQPKHAKDIYGLKSLGVALIAQGRHEEALTTLERALRLEPRDHELWSNKGVALSSLGRYPDAVRMFEAALALKPDDADALANLGWTYYKQRDFKQALAAYNDAVNWDEGCYAAWRGLARVLLDNGDLDDAIICHGRALMMRQDDPFTLMGFARTYKDKGMYAEACAVYAELVSRFPQYGDPVAAMVHLSHWNVDWESLEQDMALLREALETKSIAQPFQLLSLDIGPDLHLKVARCQARREVDSLPVNVDRRAPDDPRFNYKHRKLRIGYISSDFGNHPVGRLVAGVLAAHDKQHFRIFGYSADRARRGHHVHTQIKSACDSFIEVSRLGDVELVDRLRRDEIDILVDLNGWTRNNRLRAMSLRAAPIQVTWLGYPGTTGFDGVIDYLIGDPVTTPLAMADDYSEKLALMPHCYQPNDDGRPSQRLRSRQRAGLPASGIVFCSFNNYYKILPTMLDAWCRIMKAVPGSVIWLLNAGDIPQANLQEEFSRRGIGSERLIFARRVPADEHLARLALADIALDTFPYGSHTTGSDALWMGVPLVSLMGTTFASRVAASLLRAIGVPELAVTSQADYEALAIHLASDPVRLKRIRQKLRRNRDKTPLFDTAGFARDLEQLYRRMMDRHHRGLAPDHLLS